jgi:hypothetical protein
LAWAAGSDEPIGSVVTDKPIVLANSHGDTWVAAWAADGNVYTPSNDTEGFNKRPGGNLAFGTRRARAECIAHET